MSVSLEEAKKYIDAIDFSQMIDKLIHESGWLKEDVEQTCSQYRNFLFLNKKYHAEVGVLPPSEDIDEFWHSHILDTHAYIRDCEAIFGNYMHHYPYFGIDDKSDMTTLNNAFEITKKLYLKEFGEPILPTRSKYPTVIYFILKKIQTSLNSLPRLFYKAA